MRVAAIDCGTNSIRLLISDDGVELAREMRIVRLGQGVDRTGRLDPAAIERTSAAITAYRQMIEDFGVSRIRMVATSATRDAANAADFQEMVRGTLGQDAEVISGDEEAALSFDGAVSGLPIGPSYLVVDIGGGSTEFVREKAARSMDIGCVRMTERHLHDDPPTPSQLEAALVDIRQAVTEGLSAVDATGVTLVGVAGTVTTLAGMALDLPHYDRHQIHHSILDRKRIEEIYEQLSAMDHDQRAAIPVMHPGRVDVITAGALILREVVRQADAKSLIVSEQDILDGIARSLSG